jgi:uncharacterized membrane protein
MADRILRIAQFVTIVLFALVMGVFWGTWFSLSRSITAITPQTFLEVGHLMITNLGGPMSVLMPGALLASAVVMVLLFRRGRDGAFYLTLIGLLLMAAALVVTLTVNVPIDYEINEWTRNTLPPDWTVLRERWQFYHTVRTFASIASLGFVVAGAMRVASMPSALAKV